MLPDCEPVQSLYHVLLRHDVGQDLLDWVERHPMLEHPYIALQLRLQQQLVVDFRERPLCEREHQQLAESPLQWPARLRYRYLCWREELEEVLESTFEAYLEGALHRLS